MRPAYSLFASLACVLILLGFSTPSFGGDVSQPANVDQISGNVSIVYQRGSANTANVEQQAILGGYANVSTVVQAGDHDTASVTQTGSNDKVSILQFGHHDTATVQQNRDNLAARIIQWGNGSPKLQRARGAAAHPAPGEGRDKEVVI